MRERPLLCLVTDPGIDAGVLVRAVEAAVAAGVDRVQIRARGVAPDLVLLAHAEAIAAAAGRGARARGGRVELVINRRADLCLALGLDGVHAGFDALPVARLRTLLGEAAQIGVSAHAPDEIARAAREGASYAHLAPVFAPISKRSERPPLGLDGLRAAVAASGGLDVVAQGGIDETCAASVVRAGAVGVAVIGAILGDADPAAATTRLRRALDAA